MDNEQPVLAVSKLAVHFQGRGKAGPPVRAVDGVSFVIAPGETLGLVGESGCGKSTIANAVVGLVPPTAGSVRIKGREVSGASGSELRDIRRNVQLIFQDPNLSLNPRMSVGAAIGEPLLVRGIARGKQLSERVAAILESVGLTPEHAARYPHQFSGGQRQRVVIARGLAVQPALVVCDEPVSALDVSVRAQILNLLVDLQRKLGIAYLFVSHDLSVVRHICDRVAVMYLGCLVEVSDRETLFATPKHPYTRALMSSVLVPDPIVQRTSQRTILRGELPSPSNVPTGCAFHTRCPIATEICRRVRPQLTPRPDSALVACHHA